VVIMGEQMNEITNVPVTVAGNVVQGPDGRPWGLVQISVGTTQFGMALPEQTLTELPTVVEQVLSEVAVQVRRAKLGLLLPTQVGAEGSRAPGAGLVVPGR
jgi:hypothetical protein